MGLEATNLSPQIGGTFCQMLAHPGQVVEGWKYRHFQRNFDRISQRISTNTSSNPIRDLSFLVRHITRITGDRVTHVVTNLLQVCGQSHLEHNRIVEMSKALLMTLQGQCPSHLSLFTKILEGVRSSDPQMQIGAIQLFDVLGENSISKDEATEFIHALQRLRRSPDKNIQAWALRALNKIRKNGFNQVNCTEVERKDLDQRVCEILINDLQRLEKKFKREPPETLQRFIKFNHPPYEVANEVYEDPKAYDQAVSDAKELKRRLEKYHIVLGYDDSPRRREELRNRIFNLLQETKEENCRESSSKLFTKEPTIGKASIVKNIFGFLLPEGESRRERLEDVIDIMRFLTQRTPTRAAMNMYEHLQEVKAYEERWE